MWKQASYCRFSSLHASPMLFMNQSPYLKSTFESDPPSSGNSTGGDEREATVKAADVPPNLNLAEWELIAVQCSLTATNRGDDSRRYLGVNDNEETSGTYPPSVITMRLHLLAQVIGHS